MRVVIKKPGAAPEIAELRNATFEAIADVCDAVDIATCITHDGIRVYCDDNATIRSPRPAANLIRPTDTAIIYGPVVVTAMDGPDTIGLDDRQCALWMATLALIGIDNCRSWRAAALADLASKVHEADASLFEQLSMVHR